MKKNEKQQKNKYGVFNGSVVSQETIGTEKSLIIRELEEQDFSIEKADSEELDKNTMFIDEQTLLDKKKRIPLRKWIKWVLALLAILIAIGIIVIIAVKIGL